MPFSYANPTSGPSAGGIGWFNFENLTINPGGTVTGLTGTLNNGNIVTFDMALTLLSGTGRPYVATQPPTFPTANFDVTGYTGIIGNVAMQGDLIPEAGTSLFTISNIVVRQPDNTPVPNYTVVLADAERTNIEEELSYQSNGGGWQLFTTLGNAINPILTGLGTQTASIIGNNSGPTNAYVLTSQAPTQLDITIVNGVSSRQAIAVGFATTHLSLVKNVAGRSDPTDQFVLNIAGTPGGTATTTGNADGVQAESVDLYIIPGNTYTLSESIAPGSASTLSDYKQVISAANATPAGTVPPTGNQPITFTAALGDDVSYTFLNVAPEKFTKTVDKAFADIGDIITYTIIVENPNDTDISNVLVTDPTPPGTTYIGNLVVSQSYTGTDLSSGITITNIPANTSATVSWQVQVNTVPPIQNPISNVGSVSVPGGTSGNTNVVTTQVNTAFVSINKMADKAFANVGDIITYTLMLNNAGNVEASNIILTDAIPAGTTFVPGSVTGATGTPPTLTLANPISAGGNATVTFQVKVGNTVPTPNPLQNSATAAYNYTVDPANPNGASGTAASNTFSTQVNTATVTTTKAANLAFAVPGDIITYTITLSNTGNVDADNAVITDAIPAGTTFVPGSVTGATGTPPNLTLSSPVPANGNAIVTFQVQIDDTIPTPNPLANSASTAYNYTVNPANPNGVSGTSQSNIANTQVNVATITTNKSVDKSYAQPGDIITYTLNLKNTGNVAADNVVITDAVPVGTTFVPGSVTGATGVPPTLTLANPIAQGETATVTFQVKVDAGNQNSVINSADVAFTFTTDPANPDGENGTGASNEVTTQINYADVTSTKSAEPAFSDVGDVITYSINLQNTGNVAATNVVITDQIPVGTTFVPGSVTGATGTPPTLTVANIPSGGNAIVTYQVKVSSTIPNTNPIVNTASVAYKYTVDPANPNAVSGTSSSTANVQVNNATLTIHKMSNKTISYIGDTITYQFTVQNTGNVPANNVVITDAIPVGTTYVPNSLSVSVPATGTPPVITLTNPVAPGAVVAISFEIKVAAIPNPNPIVNKVAAAYTYTIDPSEPDGVSATATSNSVSTVVFRNNYSQQISDLIESVALEQAALAAIANAEGAKIQKIVSMPGITQQELLCLNKSVSDMMDSISLLESLLKQKINVVNCQINGTCI